MAKWLKKAPLTLPLFFRPFLPVSGEVVNGQLGTNAALEMKSHATAFRTV